MRPKILPKSNAKNNENKPLNISRPNCPASKDRSQRSINPAGGTARAGREGQEERVESLDEEGSSEYGCMGQLLLVVAH